MPRKYNEARHGTTRRDTIQYNKIHLYQNRAKNSVSVFCGLKHEKFDLRNRN